MVCLSLAVAALLAGCASSSELGSSGEGAMMTVAMLDEVTRTPSGSLNLPDREQELVNDVKTNNADGVYSYFETYSIVLVDFGGLIGATPRPMNDAAVVMAQCLGTLPDIMGPLNECVSQGRYDIALLMCPLMSDKDAQRYFDFLEPRAKQVVLAAETIGPVAAGMMMHAAAVFDKHGLPSVASEIAVHIVQQVNPEAAMVHLHKVSMFIEPRIAVDNRIVQRFGTTVLLRMLISYWRMVMFYEGKESAIPELIRTLAASPAVQAPDQHGSAESYANAGDMAAAAFSKNGKDITHALILCSMVQVPECANYFKTLPADSVIANDVMMVVTSAVEHPYMRCELHSNPAEMYALATGASLAHLAPRQFPTYSKSAEKFAKKKRRCFPCCCR